LREIKWIACCFVFSFVFLFATVAGTWLMTLHGLRVLCGNELPVRGEIKVYMADARDAGITGGGLFPIPGWTG